ncbi:TetR/AcrR family transcriptional regulator [Crassaminicella profunda]|uniref:TetR/AcrR family transcriptional regulator n=1 Tax=Crassaminicella profunda TaxID=1286698 RepID=UPI001CA6A211|nr:TetR/AcrR family transcriptional regulator [Crassaminicella profunda]QZY53579.1 TetR/AcrR family transcriptional regulator [Crassaminicella profunda]
MEKIKAKKQFIIQAAMKIFCRDGFHKAKVSEIAVEAGVGKGTIYEYFDSKKQLFIEMMKYYADLYYENLTQSMEKEKTIMDKFKRYILLEEETMTNHGDLAQIFMREAYSIGLEVHKIMKTRRKKQIDFFANLIQEGINEGIFRKIHPYTAALTFMGSVHHMLVSKIFIKDNFSEEINMEELHDLLFNGIKK